jgi:hypothetical protein
MATKPKPLPRQPQDQKEAEFENMPRLTEKFQKQRQKRVLVGRPRKRT